MIEKIFICLYIYLFTISCSLSKKAENPTIDMQENPIFYSGYTNKFSLKGLDKNADSIYVKFNEIQPYKIEDHIFYFKIPQNYKSEKYRLYIYQYKKEKLKRESQISINLKKMESYIDIGIIPEIKIYDSIPIGLFKYLNGLLGWVENFKKNSCAVKSYNISILRDSCLIYNSKMHTVYFDESFKDFVKYMQTGDVIIFSNACMDCFGEYVYCDIPPLVYYLK